MEIHTIPGRKLSPNLLRLLIGSVCVSWNQVLVLEAWVYFEVLCLSENPGKANAAGSRRMKVQM